MKNSTVLLLAVYTVALLMTNCAADRLVSTSGLQAKIDSIQTQIEEIRGAKFKHSVQVANQSLEDFGAYIDRNLDKQFSEELNRNYSKIVRKLGLYRGPEIADFKELAKMVFQSQAAAYYDPETSTFYVVMQNLPESSLRAVYSHEIYHGFQDQHHDLDSYLLAQIGTKLNDDELMARQAVVEGEATYIMTLWTTQMLLGIKPNPGLLSMAIKMQANMEMNKLLEMLKTNIQSQPKSDDLNQALAAMDKIPPFMLETMIGAYLKGMAFIFEIQQESWDKVDELYTSPPASSEQILHPDKWLQRENPFRFSWPDFEKYRQFDNWRLLESNTIGELQWRIIFSVHEMVEAGKKAAAGWDGDSFAVFEEAKTGALLLLICTSWDSDDDAKEFHAAYTEMLSVKYPNQESQARTMLDGRDVFIVEGGEDGQLAELIQFMKREVERSKVH